MWNRTRGFCAWGVAAFAACALAQSPGKGHSVLLVSIDGLRPDYVLGSAHSAESYLRSQSNQKAGRRNQARLSYFNGCHRTLVVVQS